MNDSITYCLVHRGPQSKESSRRQQSPVQFSSRGAVSSQPGQARRDIKTWRRISSPIWTRPVCHSQTALLERCSCCSLLLLKPCIAPCETKQLFDVLRYRTVAAKDEEIRPASARSAVHRFHLGEAPRLMGVVCDWRNAVGLLLPSLAPSWTIMNYSTQVLSITEPATASAEVLTETHNIFEFPCVQRCLKMIFQGCSQICRA
jgi:hypothetical protein